MLYEKLKALKMSKNLTIQEISEKSGVPSGTVSRIFSGQTDNPSFQNICDIVIAMGGSLDELAGIKNTESTDHTNADTHAILMQMCRERIEDKEREIKKWTRIIRILSIAFISLVIIIIALLIYDVASPGMGYIRY